MNDNKPIIFVGSVLSVLLGGCWLINARPVLAHHPSGGAVPDTFMAGLMSGFGHPVIGIDHLVFVIAVGLLAITSKKLGMIIPVSFVAATALGTLVHLQSIDLPVPELVISASIFVAGIFLAREDRDNPILLTIVTAIAGIFHGYAYGESIVGAETTALGAYLLGFCAIQLVISAIAFTVGQWLIDRPDKSSLLRFAGFAICGVGFAFLSNVVLG